jgi:hypothetical protein
MGLHRVPKLVCDIVSNVKEELRKATRMIDRQLTGELPQCTRRRAKFCAAMAM